MWILLFACNPPNDDTAAADDTAAVSYDWHVLLSTTDYTTGALARINSDTTVSDNLAPISSDSHLDAEADAVYLLQRSSENTARVYQPGEYTAPTLEFSTGDGSNPTAMARCGDQYFVARQLLGDVAAYDVTTGLLVATVDLSAWADADGSSEPDALYVAPDGVLYVSLLQLDYINTYSSVDGTGTLLAIDCTSHTVLDEWETGPNPNLVAGAPGQFFLSGGDYFTDDFSGPDLDGGVWTFDTTSRTLAGPFLRESELGRNIGGIHLASGSEAMATLDDGYRWSVVCVDTGDWSLREVDVGNVFVPGMVTDPDGGVWLAQAPGFDFNDTNPDDDQLGLVRWNAETCTSGAVVNTTLGASSLVSVSVTVQP